MLRVSPSDIYPLPYFGHMFFPSILHAAYYLLRLLFLFASTNARV